MTAQHLIAEKKKEAENGGKFRRKVLNLQKWKLERRQFLQAEAEIARR